MQAAKDPSTYNEFACRTGLYYDSSAIDVLATLDMSGVIFTFRDTAWEETGYEILRHEDVVGSSAENFAAVVKIEGGLKGCAAEFSSITYIDREAGVKPGLMYKYAIRTKVEGDADFISLTHSFKSPWLTVAEGNVFAGGTTVPVEDVRVCIDFVTRTGSLIRESSHIHDEQHNLALFKRVSHTSSAQRTAEQSAFIATDGDPNGASGSVSLETDEYLRIDLSTWSGVSSVQVCVPFDTDISTHPVKAYVSDVETRTYGHMCKEHYKLALDSDDNAGTNLTSYHGRYLNVVASANVSVTEVYGLGRPGRCTYTTTTDADGRYELELRDFTGRVPVKSYVAIGAYKEEIYPETVEELLDTSDVSSEANRVQQALFILQNEFPDELEDQGDDEYPHTDSEVPIATNDTTQPEEKTSQRYANLRIGRDEGEADAAVARWALFTF